MDFLHKEICNIDYNNIIMQILQFLIEILVQKKPFLSYFLTLSPPPPQKKKKKNVFTLMEKQKLLVMSDFSFSHIFLNILLKIFVLHTVFSKELYSWHVKVGFVWERVKP